jgi:hypothetical protein
MATYGVDKPHTGAENIVIGFDIGTTHSKLQAIGPYMAVSYVYMDCISAKYIVCSSLGAVSFAYLYPGEHPEVRSVSFK